MNDINVLAYSPAQNEDSSWKFSKWNASKSAKKEKQKQKGTAKKKKLRRKGMDDVKEAAFRVRKVRG